MQGVPGSHGATACVLRILLWPAKSPLCARAIPAAHDKQSMLPWMSATAGCENDFCDCKRHDKLALYRRQGTRLASDEQMCRCPFEVPPVLWARLCYVLVRGFDVEGDECTIPCRHRVLHVLRTMPVILELDLNDGKKLHSASPDTVRNILLPSFLCRGKGFASPERQHTPRRNPPCASAPGTLIPGRLPLPNDGSFEGPLNFSRSRLLRYPGPPFRVSLLAAGGLVRCGIHLTERSPGDSAARWPSAAIVLSPRSVLAALVL